MAKVYVGLSGGVDSAVTAHLLLREGHSVVGAFIKGWEPDFLPCTGTADRLSAMRVAAHLGIPFETVDLEDEYKRDVVDYFVREYRDGRTPNPDVACNRFIKFGSFWQYAKKNGAEFIATGHYADIKVEGDVLSLHRSRDHEKDQSYFLWTLSREDLAHIRMPLGRYRKSEVRALARSIQLPNADRKDSQGLCFLGHVDMHDFLIRTVGRASGRVVSPTGETLGEHDGVHLYTLGQRVPVIKGERYYVIEKRNDKNELVAASTIDSAPKTKYRLSGLHFVSGVPTLQGIEAQYRYHGPMVGASIENDTITFAEPVLAAQGQSVVLYAARDSEMLGGGIIEQWLK